MVLEKSRHQMAYTTAPVIIKYTEAPDLVTRENFQLSFVPLFSNYDQQQGVCMGVPVTSIVADIPTMVISPCAPSKSPHVVYVEDMPEQITSNSFLVTTSSRYPNLDGFMQFDAQQGKMVMKHSAYHFKDTNFLKGDGATSSLVIPI
jgi:hypothetical protein